jgi:hypothetical protein
MKRVVVALAVACGGVDAPHPLQRVTSPPPSPEDPEPAATTVASDDAIEATIEDMAAAPAAPAERWLRGSTHVHARPSGDSTTPIADVITWYEQRGYDFIVLTDHNKVSELGPGRDTSGRPTIRDPADGLIVFAGTELTHNPRGCLPPGHAGGACRIHVNVLGVTARPPGKIDWPDRTTKDRVAKYASALAAARTLGGIPQVNHPQWYWGMTPDVLVEIARRGIVLFELANVQFPTWNAGDADHPSTEALWDAALARGVTLWAVASDDAHDYEGRGPYPPGGGWIVVRARRDPDAILEAIAAGRFYASTGVELDRAEVVNGELVVEVAESAGHTIELIENGARVATVDGKIARRAVPASGYVRAVVTRRDGAKAWVQPARR